MECECPAELVDNPMSSNSSLPDIEVKVGKFWEDINAFANSLKKSEGRPEYHFYDGPPFATGLPHYGHILAGTIKDVVTRYWHMMGYHCERRWGWDCHGLPVEYEIDKKLGITGPEDVMKMGIEKYNAECRSIVMKYSAEWEKTVTRMGRWIDFKNDYKTMYTSFMESVWWVFNELFKKNLVYRGYNVMPFSTACTTPLSNFEASQKYEDVKDPAIMISFPRVDDLETSFVAWTTTPWTLPSNLALVLHPDFVYVKVKDLAKKKNFIVAECRLEALYPPKKASKKSKKKSGGGESKDKAPENEYEIVEKFKGIDLQNIEYVPLFPSLPYVGKYRDGGAYRVITDSYVTEDSGTGVVHSAPGFGADDYRVSLKHKIITQEDILCPVDETGKFTADVTDYAGRYVKDCDRDIIHALKASGRLIHESTIVHSYPFCWRSDTPLIYRAVPSWLIRVSELKTQMIENNDASRWVPANIQHNRFGKWLIDARDWVVSRNRYWGTPIPLWCSDDFEEVVCVGSVAELEELTGVKGITDLHRETVDKLEIPSKKGKGMLKRIPEVLDCWFESGSMPYASFHYPFENVEKFEKIFPADFIAEGLDQTRGWFYTLLVLSTALFGSNAFKNLIVNGLVLAEDGRKMSKSKQNFEPPQNVIDTQGADSLRLYLINSPVVRAESLKFNVVGVRDVRRDLLIPLLNAFRFFLICAERFDGGFVPPSHETLHSSTNILDRWILTELSSLTRFVHTEMSEYRLYTVVPKLVGFCGYLTNWYVRFNRQRMKSYHQNKEDAVLAVGVLFEVLQTFSGLMSPYTPFLAEYIYQNIKKFMKEPEDSIHYTMMPKCPESDVVDSVLVTAMQNFRDVILASRTLRDRHTLPIKTPIASLRIVHHDRENVLKPLSMVESYIKEEMNAREIVFDDHEKEFVIKKLGMNMKLLGPRLGKSGGKYRKAITALSDEEVEKYIDDPETGIVVDGETFKDEDLVIERTFTAGDHTEASGGLVVVIDTRMTPELIREGELREIKTNIQKMRKKAELHVADKINIWIAPADGAERVGKVMSDGESVVSLGEMLKNPVHLGDLPADLQSDLIIVEEVSVFAGEPKTKIALSMRK